ncbi:MAG: AI-2E family transporter [Candidatus Colwellbacteria bacterium]|nr:AI-2E family transporter [Candidatus Colwellbacteria bacterium]
MSRTELEITWGSLWRTLAVVILCVILFFAKDAMIALLLAIIISSALDAPVAYLNSRFRIPRFLATTAIFAMGLLLLALLIYIILPVIILEITSLAGMLSGTGIGSIFSDVSSVIKMGTDQFSLVNIGQLVETLFKGTSPVIATIGNILSGMVFAFSVLIISFYLTLTRDGVGKFLRAVLPERYEEGVLAIYYTSKRKIGRWLQAQILLSVVIGVLVSTGLWLLGVKYSLVIGLLAGMFEIMPIVGPIFSGAVGTLIALSDSFSLGIYTMLLFVVIQQLENHLLVPVFMKKVVDIHPVVALFSIMAGSQLLGIAGMVISVPVAVVVQDVIEARLEKRKIRKAQTETNEEIISA